MHSAGLSQEDARSEEDLAVLCDGVIPENQIVLLAAQTPSVCILVVSPRQLNKLPAQGGMAVCRQFVWDPERL